MITLETIPELRKKLAEYKAAKLQTGFVPTMGALHPGHVSLLKRAREENPVVICSIFVNPTQFNDPQDLERYPRTPEKDMDRLQKAGCDLLFMPSPTEMYPSSAVALAKEGYKNVNLGSLATVMEASQRPGHFEGVMQIVSKLFDIVDPDRSYFGQKDFQQVAVIRAMVKQLAYRTQIIACPTLREADGLAMSSRNTLLPPEHRKLAPVIYKTLQTVKDMALCQPVQELLSYATAQFAAVPEMTLEYFQISDASTLLPVQSLNDTSSVVACVAVKLGKVR
ncbi:MAG TPA: pantoate--beta-alanine ligase, partial [Bacteroidia bacterium]|nr:pantoate--beta-alanine ligase [Bacteroidia bacterium]